MAKAIGAGPLSAAVRSELAPARMGGSASWGALTADALAAGAAIGGLVERAVVDASGAFVVAGWA